MDNVNLSPTLLCCLMGLKSLGPTSFICQRIKEITSFLLH